MENISRKNLLFEIDKNGGTMFFMTMANIIRK